MLAAPVLDFDVSNVTVDVQLKVLDGGPLPNFAIKYCSDHAGKRDPMQECAKEVKGMTHQEVYAFADQFTWGK